MEKRWENKRLRLPGFDYSSPKAYLITICTKDRRRFFTRDKFNQEIIECLMAEKTRSAFKIFAYCLMPDHLHLLLAPTDGGITVSGFIGAFKSRATRIAWGFGITGKIWQWRFHDRILRGQNDLRVVVMYLLNNPVKQGLVTKWQDYKYVGLVDPL